MMDYFESKGGHASGKDGGVGGGMDVARQSLSRRWLFELVPCYLSRHLLERTSSML